MKHYCNVLQAFDEGKLRNSDGISYRKIMIQMPPRFGKSLTIKLRNVRNIGIDQTTTIMFFQYNDDQTMRSLREQLDIIRQVTIDNNIVVYSDIFPNVKIKKGSARVKYWAVEGSNFTMLGSGPGGSSTGTGAKDLIYDDVLQSAKDANNRNHQDSLYLWVVSTTKSRQEKGNNEGKEIWIGTIWTKWDPMVRIVNDPQIAKEYYSLKLKVAENIIWERDAFGQNDEIVSADMLCSEVYSVNDLRKDMRLVSKDPFTLAIYEANYFQNMIDIQGRLYRNIMTYTDFPRDDQGQILSEKIGCITDTADIGECYLCSIGYRRYKGIYYILDILYTQDWQMDTEGKLVEFLVKNAIIDAKIESNNGGAAYAAHVREKLRNKYPAANVSIMTYHQSQNKEARILTNALAVVERIRMPVDWATRWPLFYGHVVDFQAKYAGNKYYDAPDVLTAIVEERKSEIIVY